jgi:hypothetical protein
MSIELVTLGLSLFGAKKSYDASKEAAKQAKEVGQLEGRQFVNELFLGKAQAIGAANQRRQEQTEAEASNFAFLIGKQGRDDRSVDAFLKRNQEIADEDIANIDRQTEILSAKYATQAAVAYTYGQNTASGLRAQATANLLTNMSDIAQNMSPGLVKSLTPGNKDTA